MENKIINIKNYYDKEISHKKQSIKSLQMFSKDQEILNSINKLKSEIKYLRKIYKQDKKQIIQKNNKKVSEIHLASKELKKHISHNSKIWDQKTYSIMKEEYDNLKLRKKSVSNKKYRDIYGSSVGRTKKEFISKSIRIFFILLLLFLFLIPFWLIITYSTKTSVQAASTEPFATFIPSTSGGGAKTNYDLAWKNLKFWNSLVTTLLLTIISNVLILFFAAMAAWQLVRSNKWWSKLIFYSFLVAMILPFQAIMIPLITQMRRLELNGTVFGTIVAYIGFGMALSVFMIHGFLKSVPQALEESAAISGLGPFRIFYKVVLPLLKNTFITILVLNIMWIWNDYLLPSLLLNNPYGSQTLQVRLVDTLTSAVAKDLKAISAGVVILVIPPIVYFTFAQKKMVSGITNGSIK